MIVFNNADHGHKIARTAGCYFNPSVDISISRIDGEGRLLGGVIYTNFTRESIAMHVAAYDEKWITRELIWVCFHYPFVQLGVRRVFGQVPETNTKALEFDLRLGFKIVTKIDGVFPDGGVFVLVMEKDDCRWLSMEPRLLKSGKDI